MLSSSKLLVAAFLVSILWASAGCVRGVERSKPVVPTAFPAVQFPAPTAPALPQAAATPVPAPIPTREASLPPAAAPTPTAAPVVVEFFLEVRGPADGTTVQGDAVVVHGITSPGASVSISGLRVPLDKNGSFQTEVGLSPGANTIEVIATDPAGQQQVQELKVTSLAAPRQPFLLLVTEPKDQSIVRENTVRLAGVSAPDAIVSVNGVSVPVDEAGGFFTTVRLDDGPNIIDVVAANTDGAVLSAVVAIIYRP